MNKKILYGFLPIFLSLVVMFVPMRAAAAVGVGTWWDGVVTVGNTSQINSFYLTDVELVGSNYNAIYKGDFNTFLDVECYDTNVFLNGYLRKRVNINFVDNGLGYISAPQVYCEPIVMDGITASVAMVASQDFSVSFDIMLSFNNYYVSQASFRIPLLISIMSSQQFIAGSDWGSVVRLYSNLTQVEDWTGDMWQYDNLEDVPSVDGYISQQNQTIINQSQTQNNLTNEQNTLIQNQTNQQHSDSQAEINQSIQNTDQITNGYNSGVMGEAEDKFSSGAGDLTDIEDTLTDSSSSYVDNFTTSGFDTSFLQSVGPSLNYVVTWFTNFWNMGGALTSTYGLSFAIFIAFYILRVRG